MRQGATLLLAAATLYLSGTLARADAIDGEWCLGTSHFAIDGPDILTLGGNQITGNYDRHGFTYVVPANEVGAGTEIIMELLNEETVRLTRGRASPPEIWRRWSGGIEARTGLRMMPTSPRSPYHSVRRVFPSTAGRLACQAGPSWHAVQLKPAPGMR